MGSRLHANTGLAAEAATQATEWVARAAVAGARALDWPLSASRSTAAGSRAFFDPEVWESCVNRADDATKGCRDYDSLRTVAEHSSSSLNALATIPLGDHQCVAT